MGILRLFSLAAILLGAAAGCAAPVAPPGGAVSSGDYRLVWEAWREIERVYVNIETLNEDQTVASALEAVAGLTDTSPYPFLTELGKLRGQPPSDVPPEMGDLWRGLALHRQQHPTVSDGARVQAAIAGLVEGLGDPTSAYVRAENYGNASEGESVVYEGIGVSVRLEDRRITLSPREGSPAQMAGLREGDILLEVNGASVAGKSLNEVARQVRGPSGTKVRLLIIHPGDPQPVEFEAFRSSEGLASVHHQTLPDGVAYMRIDNFGESSGQEVAAALEDINRRDPLALVIDLRGNLGGSPYAALETLAQFVPPGAALLVEEDQNGARRDWLAPSGMPGLFADERPVAALVNGSTAGLAEAVAAALQDSRRATIVGVRTHGKGTSNGLTRLSDGSALYLPATRWVRPSGEPLDGVGVTPDIWVALERDLQGITQDSQFNAAHRHLEAQAAPSS